MAPTLHGENIAVTFSKFVADALFCIFRVIFKLERVVERLGEKNGVFIAVLVVSN